MKEDVQIKFEYPLFSLKIDLMLNKVNIKSFLYYITV
jgi:hypothetical protein